MPDYAQAVTRRNWEKHGERVSVFDFGAKADAALVLDGAINNGSTTFTSAIADFTEADVGKIIWIEGAGVPSGSYTQTKTQATTSAQDLLTTIVSVNSPTSVEVADAASADVSNIEARWGTDSTLSIQKAFDEAMNKGIQIAFPRGKYLTTDSITLRSDLSISGEGYVYTSWKTNAASMVMCCANVPVMQSLGTTEETGLSNINISGLTFRGTPRPGSKGVYSALTLGASIKHCAFSIFGDQALFLDSHGIFGIHVHDCSATDSCLVDDRTDYVGCFEFGPSDLFIARLESAGPGLFWGPGLYGSGKIAGIKVSGNNSWVSDCMAAGSQIGFHIGAASPVVQLTTTLTNLRADQNQGHGFVVDQNSWSCHFIGCRSHNNGLDADATYDGFHVETGTHQFTGCQVTKTPVPLDHPTQGFNFKYRDCFHLNAGSDIYEPSKFNLCFVGDAYVGDRLSVGGGRPDHLYTRDIYHYEGLTRKPVVLSTTNHPATDKDDFTVGMQFNAKEDAIFFEAADGDADTRTWAIGANVLPGQPNTFGLVALNDDRDSAIVPLAFYRNLTTGLIDYIIWKDSGGIYIEDSVAFLDLNTYLSLKKGVFFVKEDAAVDEKRWTFGPGADDGTTGSGQFLASLFNDATDAAAPWLIVNRSGINPISIRLTATDITLDGNLRLDSAGTGTGGVAALNRIKFLHNNLDICTGSGDPNGEITANPGSMFLAATGEIWIKRAGSGNSGWEKELSAPSSLPGNSIVRTDGGGNITTGAVDLSLSTDVINTLGLTHGGLGATTAAGGRITLDVYSKSDVDGMIAAIYTAIAGKATAGAATGTSAGHSHTQT